MCVRQPHGASVLASLVGESQSQYLFRIVQQKPQNEVSDHFQGPPTPNVLNHGDRFSVALACSSPTPVGPLCPPEISHLCLDRVGPRGSEPVVRPVLIAH